MSANAAHQIGYRDVMRLPHTARLLSGSLIGRLPGAMIPLALLRAEPSHGIAFASVLASLYLLSAAVGGPLVSRLVDRYEPRWVLSATSAVSSLALLALVCGRQQTIVGGAVLIAGALAPPLDATVRALWPTLTPSGHHLRRMLALDTSAQELLYIAGPLLVATPALAAGAGMAFVADAVLSMLGTALVLTAVPARRLAASRTAVQRTGPLRSADIRLLCLAMVCAGGPIGAVTVIALRAANHIEAPALASALPAALSVGAVVGGLLHGRRTWQAHPLQQLTVLCSLFALGWLPFSVAHDPLGITATTFLAGLAMAPLISGAYLAATELAPPGHSAETNALVASALGIGCALGTATAGIISSTLQLPAAAAAATAAARRRKGTAGHGRGRSQSKRHA
ncbi:MFS transporter [Streptomyces sp. NBC_01497]|uniref:MFS transporter n=1 Tax=Streptomyces sp. NBC_01497 TaxID=2903885 RepID=UPI002E359DD0|nr:MFS transporter [Streptomyces sp. NBC_01497]